jgi:hypothetical protein
MCFFSSPSIPAPPQPAQFQQQKLPDGGSTNAAADYETKRRRALAATAFTGSLGLGQPTTTATVLGG